MPKDFATWQSRFSRSVSSGGVGRTEPDAGSRSADW
jgi:hypothetical protein